MAVMQRDVARTSESSEMSVAGISAQPLDRVMERIIEKFGAGAVFGEEVVTAEVTIVPVAHARYGFGGVTGGESSESEGGVAGGGVDVRPLGFIEIRGGVARFQRIRAPWTEAVVPLAALATGLAGPRLLRAGMRWYAARRH